MWKSSSMEKENDHIGEEEASIESQSESNSFESGLTIQASRDDSDSKLGECSSGWTNEKHNSYLDYLENSFVKQLYSLLDGDTRILSRARDDSQPNTRKSSDQFLILQKGRWQKVNFGKKQDHSEISSEFRFQKCSSRWNSRNSTGHEYAAQSIAEASGQNFKEEVETGCNSEASRKRKREAKCDDSSLNDQVVP